MILKICGITNAEDAQAAIAAGATAIGFNFYPGSPRYIAPQRAAGIPTPGVRRVGVFVNEAPARIAEIARIAALDTAQLHGDEPPTGYPGGLTVWKAIRVTEGFSLAQYAGLPAEALLLDGLSSGETFDWNLAASGTQRLILAGGLDADNVARAISLVHPWGVDVCSRIESAPGLKDHKRMSAFLQAARKALLA
ncbi:MAG TPA: phosphoribosylanthranilate isomerase [Candidatus Acidoferrales bacterium]|nr:phosphoribosylanthranilate isomerase [Candidatus Acidoferrales bacterium]